MTFAILDPVRQKRLYYKAQTFEQRARTFVVRYYLRVDLPELQDPGQREHFRAERFAEAPGLPFGSHVDRELAELPSPTNFVQMETCIALQSAIRLG